MVLELEDLFSSKMARAAASAALLNRELDSLSRDSVRTRRSVSDIDSTTDHLGKTASGTGREVDKLSGRMRIFADAAAVLGPALAPIGAVAVPAITTMAAQLGFAATAAGTAVLAFQGVGGALKALNTAALTPTRENLDKAQVALENLSPAARDFVAEVGRMLPELKGLRDVAASGLFPGLTAGFSELETALPHVRDVIQAVSTELGHIGAAAGATLASDRWTSFLDFVAQNAPSALGDMAKAAEHTAHAVAELWMATDPLNDDFSTWLVNATAAIDHWAGSLAKTQGFADFVAYIEQTGPDVAAAFGAIANAAVQIVQATAPLGGPVLHGIEALANVVAAIADSDLGTPLFTAAAALALFNRTMGITRAIGRTTFGGMIGDEVKASAGIRTLIGDFRALNRETQLGRSAAPMKGFIGPLTEAQAAGARLRETLPALVKTSALLGGVAIASTGAADKIGLTNAASLALVGTLGGPWGAALGGAAGLLIDASHAGDGFTDAMKRADLAVRGFDTSAIQSSIRDLQKQRRDLSDVTGVGDFFSDRITKALHAGAFKSNAIDEIDAKITKLKGQLDFTQGEASSRLLADGFSATAAGIDSATSSTQNFERELQNLSDVLAGRASFRAYEQALIDFTKRAQDRAKVLADISAEEASFAASQANSARDLAAAQKSGNKGRIADVQDQRASNARSHAQRMKDLKAEADGLKYSLDTSKQAGIDTGDLLDNIAAKAIAVAQTLDPVKRTEFLAGARTDFVKAAIAAGHTRDEAQKLADSVLGLSKVKGVVTLKVNAHGAWSVIDATAAKLERLTRPLHKINIVAQATNVKGALADIHGFDAGGWTGPGAKYQPAGIVHAEEFVVKRGPAAAFRSYLERLNQLPGYSGGGMVQRFPAQMAAPVVTMASNAGLTDHDVSRIVRGLATIQPRVAQMTVMPHNYSEFRRQQDEMDALAAFGGVPSS